LDKLRAIRSFVRIVESGSLTAAAVELNVSLPSMVRVLAALEHDLGVTLLNRTTRRIRITQDGEQYLEYCRMILAHVQEAEAALGSQRAVPHGRLGLTASVAFGQRHMASVVNEFVRRHPNVSVEFLLVNRIVSLIEEGFDVAIRIAYLDDTSLVSIPLTKVRRVVCASPGYLRRHGIPRSPQDLKAHRCVRFTGLAPRATWPFMDQLPRPQRFNSKCYCLQRCRCGHRELRKGSRSRLVSFVYGGAAQKVGATEIRPRGF
jgi:DNA-binding transcriptional LysR family regulator